MCVEFEPTTKNELTRQFEERIKQRTPPAANNLNKLQSKIDQQFNVLVDRLDALQITDREFKRVYNAGYEMRSTVAAFVKEQTQYFDK